MIPSSAPLVATERPVYVASRAAVSATLAGAAGTVAAAAVGVAATKQVEHRPALDGAVAGLVAISAGGRPAWRFHFTPGVAWWGCLPAPQFPHRVCASAD
jgi:ammonia channel protein AmtB